MELKCASGRGRKEWIELICPIVRADFDRLKSARLKFSPRVLQLVAKSALMTNPHPRFGLHATPDGDPRPLIDHIIPRWV